MSGQWDLIRQARRVKLLRKAKLVFANIGFERASMSAVAASCGVTKATIYVYFGNKAGLLQAVVQHCLDELPMPALPSPDEGGMHERLTQVARGLQLQAKHPASRALARILAHSASIPGPALEVWRLRHCLVREYLENLLSQNSHCENPALAASLFLLLVNGRFDCDSVEAPEDLRTDAAVNIFCSGLAGGIK